MRRGSTVLVALVALSAVLAGCTGSSRVSVPTPGPAAVLRGVPVSSARCPTSTATLIPLANADANLAVRPIRDITALVLCHYPRYPTRRDLTLHVGDPRFASALALLARPDLPRPTPAPVCALAVGTIRAVILAVTVDGVFLVRPPLAVCPGYQTPLPMPA